jgi:hypothetical protein
VWRQDKPDWIRGAGGAGRRTKLNGAQLKQVDNEHCSRKENICCIDILFKLFMRMPLVYGLVLEEDVLAHQRFQQT